MFLQYWRKLPDDFDGLDSAHLRQLAEHTDRMIEADRKAAAEQAKTEKSRSA